MIEFHDEVLYVILSFIMVAVLAFGVKDMRPRWTHYALMGMVLVIMVVSSQTATYLDQAGHSKVPYTEELAVAREALALKFRPPMVVRDLRIMGTGRQLDVFALTKLRKAITAQRKREEAALREPREVRAWLTIRALLAPKND